MMIASIVEAVNLLVKRAAGRQRQSWDRVIAAAILTLALVLRLPSTAPLTTDPARGLAAAFGEHALCLAAGGDPAANAGDEAPAAPGGHSDHDAAKCCQSHGAAAVVLPGPGGAIRILFARPAERFLATDPALAGRSLGRAWARAPPVIAG